jgi:hypothetical protein
MSERVRRIRHYLDIGHLEGVMPEVDAVIDEAFRAGWDGGFAHNDEWARDADRPNFEKIPRSVQGYRV